MTVPKVATTGEDRSRTPVERRHDHGPGPPSGGSLAAGRRVGAVTFAIAAAAYLVGAGRSYTYDESVTVGVFVATPSLLDPFRRQFFFNNHPFFSFLEHVVWSSGGRSEGWMRLLPALFGAAAVGLLGWWLARRAGALAGVAAAGILAANPLFSEAARGVRGYSLLALCAVASSLVMLQLVERDERRSWSIAYVVLSAGGLATHLYMGFVLAGHVAFVATRGRPSPRWRERWYLSALLGAVAYLALLDTMVGGTQVQGRNFQLGFPLELARSVLGTHPVAVASLALLVGAAVWLSRLRPGALLPAAVIGLMLLMLWLVLAPNLGVRFFVWLVPGVAACAALVVARWRPAAVLVIAAIAAMVVVQVENWPEEHMTLPKAATIVEATRGRGAEACMLGAEAVLAYTEPPRQVTGLPGVEGCDVLLLLTTWYGSRAVVEGSASMLPDVWTLPGTTLVVLSRSLDRPGGAEVGLVRATRARVIPRTFVP